MPLAWVSIGKQTDADRLNKTQQKSKKADGNQVSGNATSHNRKK